MNHYFQTALELLCGLRDAFPGDHPSLTLDRESRQTIVVMLNPEPGKVHQFKLDEADLSRFPVDVIADIKTMRARSTS